MPASASTQIVAASKFLTVLGSPGTAEAAAARGAGAVSARRDNSRGELFGEGLDFGGEGQGELMTGNSGQREATTGGVAFSVGGAASRVCFGAAVVTGKLFAVS